LWFKTSGVNDYLMLIVGPVAETGLFGLLVQTRGPSPVVRQYYNINSYLNQVVSLEIVKTATAITSVKMNNNILVPTAGFFSPPDTTNKNFVGAGGLSIWNLEIVGNHKWVGYPYGNTLGAWVDTVGSDHATTISGTPGTRKLI